MQPTSLSYDVVDVFTERAYAGNPLAVVHGAAGLSTQQLQAVAREFNLSETAFPVPVDGSTYAVRIFTPDTEVPFAGHPTVGTAWVLRRRGDLDTGEVVQRCGAGEVRVGVDTYGARLSAAVREVSGPLQLPELLASVGVPGGELASPVRAASCGLGFVYARVGADAVRRAHPVGTGWVSPATGLADPLGGVCVYAVQRDGDTLQVLSRVFCPEAGVPEDPATGSAAAGLGPVLVADGVATADGTTAYTVAQGVQVGRPSRLRCSVDAAGGIATLAHVAGSVQPVAHGTLTPPP